MNFSSKLGLPVLFIVLAACSGTAKKQTQSNIGRETPPSPEAKMTAIQNNASLVTEISFDTGSAVLNDTSRARLNELLSQAHASGNIDEVKVISWSDMEYPASSKQSLPKVQRDLADKRSDEIKTFLRMTSIKS